MLGALALSAWYALGCAAAPSPGAPSLTASPPASTRAPSASPPTAASERDCRWRRGTAFDQHAAGARHSGFRHFAVPPEPQCLRDVGCPTSARKLPRCLADDGGASAAACTLTEAHRQSERNTGQLVVLRGKLALARTTRVVLVEDDCLPSECCSVTRQQLFLAEQARPTGVQLLDASRPDAFTCLGDRSAMCCGFDLEAQEEVMAVGVWVWASALEFDVGRAVLLDPLLCALGAQDQEGP